MGRIDVLINNAGSLTQRLAGEAEPADWWRDFVRSSSFSYLLLTFTTTSQATKSGVAAQEVNVKAVYMNVHHFLKQAPDGKGTVLTVTTNVLGEHLPGFSSYIPSKLAQVKFMEFLHVGRSSVWYP